MTDAPSTLPASPARRWSDVLWSSGLVLAVLGLLVASFGGAGVLARLFGVAGVGLGLGGAALAFRNDRRLAIGAALVALPALFTIVVGGRPREAPTLGLDGAPRYTVDQGEAGSEELAISLGGPASRSGAALEPMNHPGPVSLSMSGLAALAAGRLQPATLVAAEWDNAWYAARIVSDDGQKARVHFVGWETEWDEELPRGKLRGLSDAQLPQAAGPSTTGALGVTTPTPNAAVVSLFQPAAGLTDDTDLSSLTPSATLYAQRVDLANAPIGTALPGLTPGKPFGLAARATLRLDARGSYHFGVAADGPAKLWIDDSPIKPGQPVDLAEGVHELRLEYRHASTPHMTLGLRMGTDPKALRILDMSRHGVAQVLREPGGSLRLVLAEGILFDLDKDELKQSAERALSSILASSLAPAPNAAIRIEGHTDDLGSDEHNLDLSRRRAERVRGWLVAHGRPEGTLSSEAFGEKRPRMPNDSEQHRKANRRVELVLAPPASASARGNAPEQAPAQGAPGADQPVVELLRAYYADLNAARFDANRYFEPNVERYITMTSTTTAAMNDYIRKVFPTQFKEPHFALEEGSLLREASAQYVYVEQSKYVLAGKTKSVEKRVKVRIRLSPSGKLVSLHQFQRLP